MFQIHDPDVAVEQAGAGTVQFIEHLFFCHFSYGMESSACLVQHVNQRSVGVKQEALHNKSPPPPYGQTLSVSRPGLDCCIAVYIKITMHPDKLVFCFIIQT